MASAYVQNNGNGTSTSLSGFPAGANGNTFVIFHSSFRSAGARTISSVACTNVTWTNLGVLSSGGLTVEIWAGRISGGSSGTTITLTMSGTGATLITDIHEFSGLTSPTTTDGTFATNSGTGTSLTTSAWSASFADDLKLNVAGWADGNAPSTTPSGWSSGTFRNSGTSNSVLASWKVGTQTTGSESAPMSIPGSVAWKTIIGGLRTPSTSVASGSRLTLLGLGS